MTTGIAIITSIIGIIIGWFLHLFFGKVKVVTKEVIKEIIKEVKVNQVQVAEVVIEGDDAYIVGFDYFNRKQVITIKYNKNILSNYKNGDIFFYTSTYESAKLDFTNVSIA